LFSRIACSTLPNGELMIQYRSSSVTKTTIAANT